MIIQKSLRFGLILGLINVLFGVSIYLLNVGFMAFSVVKFLALIFTLTIWIIFVTRIRKSNGNQISYLQALKSLVIMGGLSIILITGWEILHYQVLDPDFGINYVDYNIDFVESMGKTFPTDQIEEMKKQFQLDGQIQSMVWNSFLMALLASILSLVIKKSDDNNLEKIR